LQAAFRAPDRALTPGGEPWQNEFFPTFSMESNSQPSRTRHGVILFAVLLGIIHYIDRVCFGSMNTAIQRDLGLTDGDMKWVFWAFTFAYALFGSSRVLVDWIGFEVEPTAVKEDACAIVGE
jgi:hypothetical protein